MTSVPTLTLGDGREIPTVGFGCFMLTGEAGEEAMLSALKVGYRHIDQAEFYDEAAFGRALKRSGVARGELFITTKVWPGNPAWGQPAKTGEQVMESCKQSLDKMGVENVDLYLIHAAFGGEMRLEQWKACLELQKQGLCKSVGVSNFGLAHLEEIEAAGLPMPACNQLELHPMGQKRELLAYMKEKNILAVAYSSLAPLDAWREGYAAYGGSKTAAEGSSALLKAMAAKRGASEAQVLLRYGLQKGWVVLPKSSTPARQEENLQGLLAVGALSDEDMATLDALEKGAAFAFGQPANHVDPTQTS